MVIVPIIILWASDIFRHTHLIIWMFKNHGFLKVFLQVTLLKLGKQIPSSPRSLSKFSNLLNSPVLLIKVKFSRIYKIEIVLILKLIYPYIEMYVPCSKHAQNMLA